MFKINVGDRQYDMEFTRDSIRQFESMGGNITDMREKIYNSTDLMFAVGLAKHNPTINPNLAKKISDAAIDEYGIDGIYPVLAEKFMEVFSQAGTKPAGKSFLVVTPKSKTL